MQLVSLLGAATPGGLFESFLMPEASDPDAGPEVLKGAMSSSGITTEVAAETIASTVNAMIIPLVDEAVAKVKGDKGGLEEDTLEALAQLETFMVYAGKLFEELTPGAAIKPVKYNGKAGKGKLEALYGRYVASAETAGISGDSIDNLQRLFGIKDGAAERIGQKAMMEQVMEMMKDVEDGDLAGLGGLGDGAGSAMGSPEDTQAMIDVLKEALASSDADKAAAKKELTDTFAAMGLSLEMMIEIMDAQTDPKSKELVGLFKELVRS